MRTQHIRIAFIGILTILALFSRPAAAADLLILDPDGHPAADAKILLLKAGQVVYHLNDNFKGQSLQMTAGRDGRPPLPANAGIVKIIALDSTGYAEINTAELPPSAEVRLSPWARVHGKVMRGSKPWPNQKIRLAMAPPDYDPKQALILCQFEVTTDAEGAFAIDRAPAGEAQIGRLIQIQGEPPNDMTMTNNQHIQVVAGQTVNVTLGGVGRPVEGRVVLPPSLAHSLNEGWNVYGNAHTGESDDYHEFPLVIAKDGTFRVEDIVPGSYQIYFTFSRDFRPEMSEQVLAEAGADFIIAPIPGGQTDQAQKLPDIPMIPIPRVDVGDPAPDFTAKDAAGKDVKLSDFKGKFVLLDFFAPSPSRKRLDLPILSAVADAFGSESRLGILTVNLNGPPETAKNYGQANGLSWTAAALETNPHQTLRAYHINFQLSIWLIGPDGKVIAKKLTADNVKAALTTALGPEGL